MPGFSHFFMSYFDVFGSIFEKSAMTDLLKVIVSICLVSYNICMIPHVWGLTFGLNLSGAWGDVNYIILLHFFVSLLTPLFLTCIVLIKEVLDYKTREKFQNKVGGVII